LLAASNFRAFVKQSNEEQRTWSFSDPIVCLLQAISVHLSNNQTKNREHGPFLSGTNACQEQFPCMLRKETDEEQRAF